MTNRSRKLTIFVLVLMLIIIVIGAVFTTILNTLDNLSSGNIELKGRPDPLLEKLSSGIALYKNGETDVIDVSVATSFSWDRLYMFGDYTSPSEIDSVVGRAWRENCYTQVDVSDGFTLLVFTNNNIVVHCLDFPKDKGDFVIPERAYKDGLPINEARFVVDEYGELIWIGNN